MFIFSFLSPILPSLLWLQSFFAWLASALFYFNLALLVLNIGVRVWWGWKEGVESARVGDGGGTNDGDSPKFLSKLQKQQNTGTDGTGHKLMAVMGSGGHTTEMLKLLLSLANDNLFPVRVYVIAESDQLSMGKVTEFERNNFANAGTFHVKTLPRAREVGQSYISSIRTTILAAWHSLLLIWAERPDVVLSNGPAIGLPICVFARLLQVLRVHQCRIVFVESVCRVHNLSLTASILYHLHIPHVFLVQWPSLQLKYPNSEFIGRLV